MKSKSLLALSLLLLLNSCKETAPLPNNNIDKSEDAVELFRSQVDATWEFDDDIARAIQFTGENAPRVVLTDTDFQAPYDINSNSEENTNLRLIISAYNAQNKRLSPDNLPMGLSREYTSKGKKEGINHTGIFTGGKNYIKVQPLGTGYALKVFVQMKDLPHIKYHSNGAWFGLMNIGGVPAKYDVSTPAFKQYFASRPPREVAPADPNHLVKEILPSNTATVRRHFPLIGDYMPLNLSKHLPNNGNFNGKDNIGVLGREDWTPAKINPRGTIFVLTLRNETGENIRVTDIETPLGSGFFFEGYFDANLCTPFKTGTNGTGLGDKTDEELRPLLNPEGLRPRFFPHNSFNSQTRTFPIQNLQGEAGVSLATNTSSEGRFMIWAYTDENQNVPFKLRVRYQKQGSTNTIRSKIQLITPPQNDKFQDGKAYRANLIIKTPN